MDKPKRVNNAEGKTLCLVRYTVETPAGPLSAWSEEIFAAYEAQIRADEREACIDICNGFASIEGIAQKCAAAIRGRK